MVLLMHVLNAFHALIHWASKETYHFFRVTLIKIQSIKMNRNWAQISLLLIKHMSKNKRFAWVKKE